MYTPNNCLPYFSAHINFAGGGCYSALHFVADKTRKPSFCQANPKVLTNILAMQTLFRAEVLLGKCVCLFKKKGTQKVH